MIHLRRMLSFVCTHFISTLKKAPFFLIGSVDAFERNLTMAQADKDKESDNREDVPVFYKDEVEM